MFGKSENHLHVGATTLVSRLAEVIGDVQFTGNLEIEGLVRGNIIAKDGAEASVRILHGGKVIGDIRVPTVIINGELEGDVYCNKHLELAAKAAIKGNLYYTFLEVVKGARVNGKMMYQEATAIKIGKNSEKEVSQKAGQ